MKIMEKQEKMLRELSHSTLDNFLNYFVCNVQVNIIPVISANKQPIEEWTEWQSKPIPQEVYEGWKKGGRFDEGYGIITGALWRGPYEGKYLACIDIDNKKGIEVFMDSFTEIKSLDDLAQKTLVVQHEDANDEKAHIYFITEKPITKRSGSHLVKRMDIETPIIEVKSDNSGMMIGPGSMHRDGYPYRIVGTKEIKVLDEKLSDKLETTLHDIYTEFGNTNNDNNGLVPINDLFKDDFVIREGNNRQEYILRTMDSLIKRNHEILSEEQIKALAQDINLNHCKPPLDLQEFEKKWKEAKKFIFKKGKNDTNRDNDSNGQRISGEEKNTTIKELVETVQQRCDEIFLDEFHDPYVSIKINDHFETLPLEGKRFQSIILSEHFKSTRSLLNKERLSQIIDLIKANAELNPETVERVLNLRVARIRSTDFDINKRNECGNEGDCFYYDLTNSKWEIVKVTSEGWSVVSDTKVPLFRRYKNSLSQSYPNRHYSYDCIDKLSSLFNLHSHKDRLLLLVYIISLFVPDMAKPILLLYGSKGSAKTTSFELIKSIADPDIIETLSFPKDVNDLVQILNHSYVSYFDNISSISQSTSDLLCRVVTGSSYSKRTLYTVDDTFIYKLKRPIGVNGINIASAKPDFLDRCLIIAVNRITKEKRRKEEEVKQDLRLLIPDIIGWIFDTLVKVLKYKKENPDKIRLKEYPRMADFAEYGEIIARCIGFKDNEFVEAYFDNIEIQNEEVIESSVVAKVIIEFIEGQTEWEGSATYLHSILTTFLESKDARLARSKAWPNAGNSLSRKLNELTPTLREKGIEITFGYDNKLKSRVIKIRKIPDISLLSSYRSGDHRLSKMNSEIDILSHTDQDDSKKEIQSVLKDLELEPEAHKNIYKDLNKVVINIHQIANRLYEHSDTWVCKTCNHKGDKWDLFSHVRYCQNNKE